MPLAVFGFWEHSKVLFSQQSAFNDIGFAKCKEVFSTTNQGRVWIITLATDFLRVDSRLRDEIVTIWELTFHKKY